jgi:hypothetical protein
MCKEKIHLFEESAKFENTSSEGQFQENIFREAGLLVAESTVVSPVPVGAPTFDNTHHFSTLAPSFSPFKPSLSRHAHDSFQAPKVPEIVSCLLRF